MNDSEKISKYIEKQKELVDMEREEEMERHQREIKKLSGKERQRKGRAILNLKGKDEGQDLAGHLVKFSKVKKDTKLPENKISVGDLIMVSKKDPTRDDNPTGTVIKTTNYSITAAFDGRPQGFVYTKGVRVDLYVNDITFQRMKEALDKLLEPKERIRKIRNAVIGIESIEEPTPVEVENWENDDLNDSQKKAVKNSLGTEDIHLIHGPPGTGKTTTVIELIEQYVKENKKIIATADSNAAVDNIVEFLVERGVKTVRVGHPARVTKLLRKHTLDSLIQNREEHQKASGLKEKAFDLQEKQESLTFPSGPNRRGLSNSQIKKLARKNKGSRGIRPEKIRSMSKWIQLQEEVEKLFSKADKLESKAFNEILDDFEVVCTTNSTAGSSLLSEREFDILIIDEATQATEPSCLIPMTLAKKTIMAGDHKQLPPTVQSQEAKENGLDHTLFEKLAKREGRGIRDLLKTQYRMNGKIMNFSSDTFYNGKIEAHETVKNHTLSDLDFDNSIIHTKYIEALEPEVPIIFLDTKNTNSQERSKPGSHSKENSYEAKISTGLAKNALKGGLDPRQVAVITPYDDQSDLISDKIKQDNLEVKTVDGFQGREKEMVIISLVRSNTNRNIGFLSDLRRLNVALTRAKRKLILIGDSSTICVNNTYSELVKYIKENGKYIQLPF
ncbi:MAG: IGHMBP2 family helicase [Candidatus Magasanikbacteria bacterium]